MSIISTDSRIEKELESLYVPTLSAMMQISEAQAKKAVRNMIKLAKEEQKKEKMENVPKNFGNFLLNKENTDEKIKIKFAKKRKEGVRDEDIKWWFNMHDLERRMLLIIDDITRKAMFEKFIESGKNEKEAAIEIRRFQPMYGNPDDNTHTSGVDSPLPFELKNRINKYVESKISNPEQFKSEILKSSSFNAYIRNQIRKNCL